MLFNVELHIHIYNFRRVNTNAFAEQIIFL